MYGIISSSMTFSYTNTLCMWWFIGNPVTYTMANFKTYETKTNKKSYK